MRGLRIMLLSAGLAASGSVAWASHHAPTIDPITVTVSAVNGTDRNLSNAVAETLITDLARQPGLRVLERTSPRNAARARYRIVGSCLALDRHVLVSVRVLDAVTWTTIPGLAESVLAPREQMLLMVDALGQRLSQKLAARLAPVHRPVRRQVSASRGKGLLRSAAAHGQPFRAASSHPAPAAPKPAPAKIVLASAPAAVHASFTPVAPDPAPAPEETYTGLIIDARGCHLERSMTPRIRLMDGSVLWAGEDAPVDFAIENGVVAYAHTLDEARQLARAGAHPLVIQAIAAYKDAFHSDPVLREEDARALRPHLGDRFMRRFNVVFVVD
ncbi:MAG: hypothetical protein ACP5VE_13065 [Chthonomonadales bacterium]